MIRVSTSYLHMAVLIGGGNLTKGEITNFCVIYTVNTDRSPKSDSHLEGNFFYCGNTGNDILTSAHTSSI